MKDHLDGHKRKHHRKEKLLEICLFVLLKNEEMHGYRLLERLSEFGFPTDDVDAGTMYRTLRRMEENSFVESSWEDSEQGPNRRIYRITDRGLEMLSDHINHLQKRMAYLQKLLDFYHKNTSDRT